LRAWLYLTGLLRLMIANDRHPTPAMAGAEAVPGLVACRVASETPAGSPRPRTEESGSWIASLRQTGQRPFAI
jgi:hypothetical protein